MGGYSGAVFADSAGAAVSLSGNTFKNNKCTYTKSNCKANGFCKRGASGKCQ